jgi:hypothetical protein
MCEFMSELSILFCSFKCLSFCQYHDILIIQLFKYALKLEIVMSPVLLVFLKIVLATWRHLWFPMNYSVFSIFAKMP